jgi:hypothetical protein
VPFASCCASRLLTSRAIPTNVGSQTSTRPFCLRLEQFCGDYNCRTRRAPSLRSKEDRILSYLKPPPKSGQKPLPKCIHPTNTLGIPLMFAASAAKSTPTCKPRSARSRCSRNEEDPCPVAIKAFILSAGRPGTTPLGEVIHNEPASPVRRRARRHAARTRRTAAQSCSASASASAATPPASGAVSSKRFCNFS